MKIAMSLATVCLLLFLFREHWLMAIGNFLIVEDQLHPADVIHVIAGDDYRTDYAIQLFKQGYAKMIFFTGGWCISHNYYHGAHGQEVSRTQGVPLDAIAFDESTVTSTYMESEKLKEWINNNPNPVNSVIVVSDPFHMRRTRWTSRKVFGESIEVQMSPVPFDQGPYRHQWWTDSSSVTYVVNEYIKIIYYFIRYQL